MPADDSPTPNIVIVGAGAVGICTAYYLLDRPSPPRVTVVEAHELAGGASGKCSGFLALDWHGPATTPLAQLSWRLHAELAHEHDGSGAWGYRALDSLSYTIQASTMHELSSSSSEVESPSQQRPRSLSNGAQRWLNTKGDTSSLGTMDSTAQVYVVSILLQELPTEVRSSLPTDFVEGLYQIAHRKGLRYVHGRPSSFTSPYNSHPGTLVVDHLDASGTSVGETLLECTHLVITAGPWTSLVLSSLGLPALPIQPLPCHSIVIRRSPESFFPATAVFATIFGLNRGEQATRRDGDEAFQATTESPEIFPRPDGTIYVTGENNAAAFPDDPNKVPTLVDEQLTDRLERATRVVSPQVASGVVIKRQVCGLKLWRMRKVLIHGIALLSLDSIGW
jgi:glycine/D-amino acid oxidase-like deaminating enzyme